MTKQNKQYNRILRERKQAQLRKLAWTRAERKRRIITGTGTTIGKTGVVPAEH